MTNNRQGTVKGKKRYEEKKMDREGKDREWDNFQTKEIIFINVSISVSNTKTLTIKKKQSFNVIFYTWD